MLVRGGKKLHEPIVDYVRYPMHEITVASIRFVLLQRQALLSHGHERIRSADISA